VQPSVHSCANVTNMLLLTPSLHIRTL